MDLRSVSLVFLVVTLTSATFFAVTALVLGLSFRW